jgi:NADH dehydrogenase
MKLDSAEDAETIRNVVATYPSKKILVIGGGYTGIEIASNLALLLKRKNIKRYSVSVIEKGEDILGALPVWIRDYCRVVLCALRVAIYAECSLKELTDQKVRLSNGLEFEDYLIIWTAGVTTPGFVRELKFERDKQGRLNVDEHMAFAAGCFAVGDAAAFKYKSQVLRMAVLFSLAEARVASKNILRLISGEKKLFKYRPLDLGLLVPLANKKACGRIFFVNVKGFAGWVLHYCMCIYRSLTFSSRIGIFCDAFLKIGR